MNDSAQRTHIVSLQLAAFDRKDDLLSCCAIVEVEVAVDALVGPLLVAASLSGTDQPECPCLKLKLVFLGELRGIVECGWLANYLIGGSRAIGVRQAALD